MWAPFVRTLCRRLPLPMTNMSGEFSSNLTRAASEVRAQLARRRGRAQRGELSRPHAARDSPW
jgi:hypothetical protein